MSQVRPYIEQQWGRVNQPIPVAILDLLTNPVAVTYLTVDTASASGTLTVKNISGFAINQILIIGEPGNGGTEIIKTHASTAPSGTTITLAANTAFPHSSGTKVYAVLYDQVEFSTATTATGSKSVLATSSINPANLTTNYNDTAASSGYYFARFKNSISSGFSSYSDAVPVTSYGRLTAGAIIQNALSAINNKIGSVITRQYAFQEIDNCLYEVVNELKRWSWLQIFDATTPAQTGQWRVAVPSDLADKNTNKSIYNFRVNTLPLTWIDKARWDNLTQDIFWTTLKTSISVSDATITLTDSHDFASSGSITIGANSYSYTANAVTTGVLTLSAVSTTTNTAGQDVFQNGDLGQPLYYTIFGGYIYHLPAVDSNLNNTNYSIDYYSQLTPIQSESDAIVFPDPTVVQYFLEWKFLKALNNGEENDSTAAAKANYIARLARMKQKEVTGRTQKFGPRVDNWTDQSEFAADDSRRVRLGNYLNDLY